MKFLIKSATIIDPRGQYHNQQKDILITDGIITAIEDSIGSDPEITVIEKENLHVSRGWFDTSICFGEPGYEERETIANGLNTAGKSGYTGVVLNPNTNPVTDGHSNINFLKNKANGHPVNIYPVGSLTVNSEGVDLAELYDMRSAGAVAFGDYQHSVSNPNLMKLALQYCQSFNGLVMSFPQEDKIAGKGVVNEDESTIKLGLKGIPALAEELQIARDLYILEYTGGKLHIPTISTSRSVALVRAAKEKSLDVTCSVAIHNLMFDSGALNEFDTRFKVLPPLRTQEDIVALKAGLEDGTIDFITSDHNPIDIEHKKVEFDHAMYGTIGLESAFGALLKMFSLEKVIEILTSGKSRFDVSEADIKTGEAADLTLFNPSHTYTFNKSDIHSTSANSAFLGSELEGKAYGVFNEGKILLND
ncbi:dihydroorotase [Robertkochia solimangrovi]|uniref:dihydroorotase n=1 Tax=Robertkochia solimangrovi TaxID=2213046 RepID=UPI00117ED252|nr:dihydroorotase [Robertkochia solimangrovi]TRZ45336.1 dihydroorotase [Robertkochia solimangrovi]